MKSLKMILAATLASTAFSAQADSVLPAFDVTEDLSRFIFAEAPVFDDGMPAYGNPFITQGYVYPAGSLDGGVDGTLADGSPAFPNQVIGTWTCDGYLVSDGMRTETGTIVITRQIIRFTDGDLLITQGPELADVEIPVVRAVSGGTGEYATAPAEIRQTLLGMSDGYGVRLQMEFVLQQDAQLPDIDATRPGNQSFAAQEAERVSFEQAL